MMEVTYETGAKNRPFAGSSADIKSPLTDSNRGSLLTMVRILSASRAALVSRVRFELAETIRPWHCASWVRSDDGAVVGVPDEHGVGLRECDERGHRGWAWFEDVSLVVAGNEHQLESTVVTCFAGAPIGVHAAAETRCRGPLSAVVDRSRSLGGAHGHSSIRMS